MTSHNIIKGNCWLVYFDILGFKKTVESAKQIENVVSLYEQVLKEIKGRKPVVEKFVEATWFSDTFIFYSFQNSQESMLNIAYFGRTFFREMFLKNIPLRGCLTYGDFYADKNEKIYLGKALIQAYKLAEAQDWIGYILSETAKNEMDKFCNNTLIYKELQYYEEYDVPMKEYKKQFLAYNMSTLPLLGDNGSSPLCGALTMMWSNVKHNENLSDQQKNKIKSKYINTKNFLLKLYPDQERTLDYI